MPAIIRSPHKFVSKGLDLTSPCDLLPPGFHPRLMNAVVSQTGALTCRAGSTTLLSGFPSFGHTVRRLNNLNPSYSITSALLLMGFGTNLYSQSPASGPPIATGFSGNPLSVITYRPDQSTAAWAYIADQNKMVKVDVNSTVRNIGILSPAVAPSIEIDGFTYLDVTMDGTWRSGGTAGALTSPSRVPATTTVGSIIYDSGSVGWCVINPTTPSGDYGWLQPGERLILNSAERNVVEAVLPAIPTCTIASILYDSGTSGLCSITLSSLSPNLARNSLVVLGAELVRVLSVSIDTLGNISFRCSAAFTHAVGDTVLGLVSLRTFTSTTITAAETITDDITVQWTNATGTGWQTRTNGDAGNSNQPDLSQSSTGRAYGPDDLMHFSVWVSDPSLLTEGRVELDVDPTTNDFTKNYLYYAFRANDLTAASQAKQPATAAIQTALINQTFSTADPRNASTELDLGSGQWCELTFPISALIRVGTDTTRTLANVAAVRLLVTTTGSMTIKIGSWYVAGSYGTNVALGSPTGIFYLYRYRSTATGARSNPSPAPRYQLFPSRQSIGISCTSSTDPQVDVIDIFRYDPSLQSANTPTATIIYLATIPNSSPTYSDQQVAELIAANAQIETNLFQPFPVLAAPLSGTCNVSGTTVKWVSGAQFPLAMVPGTVITIGTTRGKTNYQLNSFPNSATFLELLTNAGSGTAVPFSIYSPLLTGQPLPVLFGPLEGPLATFTFALGDPANPGTLYWTNGNDPDSASDQNTIEITSPSEPLIGGCVWNTLIYVFSTQRVFLVRPSFDASGSFTFTFYALQSPTGLISSWALAAAADAVYFVGGNGEGVFKIAGEAITSVTDLFLYPLFPHGALPATLTNGYYPVDLTQITYLQLNYADGQVWFNYKDTQSTLCTMRFDRAIQGWFPQSWPAGVTSLYFETVPQTLTPRLLATTNTGILLNLTGATDNGTAITATVRTPSMDNGDPRSQKLYVDLMTDYQSPANLSATIGYDNYTTLLTPAVIPLATTRTQARTTISTIAGTLALYRNIGVEYSFSFGASLFESEPAGYIQPYLSNSFISRHDSGFPDWVCLRDRLICAISTTDLTLTVDIDGTTYTYTVPSTSGALRKVYGLFQHASKGRMFIWQLQSTSPFALFTDETIIRMKSWTGDMIDVKPFAGAIPQ